MLQCKDCEFFQISPDGRRIFTCDPFINIKEAECLAKWQLIRLDMLTATYREMVQMQAKFAPLQDKIYKYIKREIDDVDESERWKIDDDQPPEAAP